MSAKIIDGKTIAAQIYKELESDIHMLKTKYEVIPGLAVILVGENPASLVYVKNKTKMCAQIGIYSEEYRLMASSTEREVLKLIDSLNANPRIHGLLIQLPLPSGIPVYEIQRAVSPYKDVDGFHPENMGKLLAGDERFVPCTPLGVQHLLARSGIEIAGKHVVIVGRSNIVGKPLAALLVQKKSFANATVTICHSNSNNLKEITKQGDILVMAIGQAEFLKGDMVKEGAVVIDVGMNRVGEKLFGDVHFESVKDVAGYITKVPGGVGPMTIAMLMYNTVQSAKYIANCIVGQDKRSGGVK